MSRSAVSHVVRGHFIALRLAQVGLLAGFMLWIAGCDVPAPCTEYKAVSIAEMRGRYFSGCFELAHVVVVARSPRPHPG